MQVFGWGTGDALNHVGMPNFIAFGGTTFTPCEPGEKLYWSSITDPLKAPNWREYGDKLKKARDDKKLNMDASAPNANAKQQPAESESGGSIL
jgi:hypothetical protein